MSTEPTPTGIEAAVCRDIAARQKVGIAKYSTTLEDNPAPLSERIRHAYEEALDGANYLKWAHSEAVRLETENRELRLIMSKCLDCCPIATAAYQTDPKTK